MRSTRVHKAILEFFSKERLKAVTVELAAAGIAPLLEASCVAFFYLYCLPLVMKQYC
jgi:hypothetical protein